MNVMVDIDLAELYGVQNPQPNKAVGKNLKSFQDEDFMFQLADDEFKKLDVPLWNIKLGRKTKIPQCVYLTWRSYAFWHN